MNKSRLSRALAAAVLFFLVATTAKTDGLPLNTFSTSRLAQTDHHGYFHMALALGEDYWDGESDLSRVYRHMKAARAVGAKYLRCAFSWNGIEPKQGEYHWEFWDQLVKIASENGIELIPYVGYTPKWAARSDHNFWTQPPIDIKFFTSFLKILVNRYKEKIHSWEIWNEPDVSGIQSYGSEYIGGYWSGTPEEYALLVKEGAVAIRRTDPRAVVVLGGMTCGPWACGPFHEAYISTLINRYHVENYVDVIPMHGYPESWHEQRAETVFQSWINGMMKDIGMGQRRVDFQLNEIGYADFRYDVKHASWWGTNIFYDYEHTPRYAGVMAFKFLTMAAASNSPSIATWYRIDDFREDDPIVLAKQMMKDKVNLHLGILHPDGTPKPMFHAIRFFNKLFSGKTRDIDDKLKFFFPPRPQGILNVFEVKEDRPLKKFILAGWLRSSSMEEVVAHYGVATFNAKQGMLVDDRMENFSVQLPCRTHINTRYYDVFGRSLKNNAKFENGLISGIRLIGGDLFLAEIECR